MSAVRRIVIALAMLPLAARAAAAQDAPAVGAHVRLRVTPAPEDAYARTGHEGTVVRLGADSVVIRELGRERAYALSRVQRVDVRTQVRSRRAGALRYGGRSALVAGLAGAALASAAGEVQTTCAMSPGGACNGTRLPVAGTALATGTVAGLLGAWYGATAGRYGWSRATLGRGASLGMSIPVALGR